ncbi:hypothetical protein JAAN108728_07500 [Janibacter anophelis]
MAAEKKVPPAQTQGGQVRPPAYRDKHGRPELRMPRSFVRGSVTPRVSPPKDDKSQ